MAFTPLQTQGRTSGGVNMGYAIRKTKSDGKTTSMLEISISPELVRELKAKTGDLLRIDADKDRGIARLLAVGTLGKSSRKLHLAESGRGYWAIPYSGAVAEAFPPTDGMTPITGAHVSSDDGLVFELPEHA